MKHRNRLFWLIMLVAGIFLIYSTESPVPIAARNTVKQGISNVWTATTDTVSTWLNGGPRSVAKKWCVNCQHRAKSSESGTFSHTESSGRCHTSLEYCPKAPTSKCLLLPF